MISVLYVDDEEILLEIAQLFLEDSGEFKVGTSTSAQEVLDAGSVPSYDAIISDYQMPGIDGIAFLKAVRAQYGDIPFILFTGRGREEVVIQAINYGVDFYIQKGGEPTAQFAELAHKIRQAVLRRRAELDRIRSEEKFSRLFITNPSLEAITDFTTGKLIDVNEAFVHITGYSRDEVRGKSTREINLFIDYADREKMAQAITEEGILHNFETRIRTKSGDIRTLDFTGQHIRIGNEDILFSQAVDITDRKRAEAALTDSESRLRSFIEATRESVTLVDEEGKVIEWNFGAERISGIRKEEALGSYLWDLTFRLLPRNLRTQEHRATIEQTIRTMLRTGVPPLEESRVVEAERPDGSRIFTRQTIFPIRTDKGFRFGSIAQEITDKKQAEDALRESEERFRGMAERSSDLIFIIDKWMSPIYVSPSARSIIGYDPEELVGKPPEFAVATIFSEAGTDLMKSVQATMEGRTVENVELRLRRKDGNPVYVSMFAVPVLQDGVPAGAQVSMRDITDRRSVEGALRESEERFRSFVENANEIVFSLTPEGIISYVSPTWTELLGHDISEVIGKPSAAFIHPEDFPRNREVFHQAVMTGKKTAGLEYRIRHNNGTWRWHSQSISPIRDAGGAVVAVLGICHDVTEDKRAQEALHESEEKFRSLVETSPDMIWEIDSRGKFRYISPRIATIMGYTQEEVMGKPITDLIPEPKRPLVMQELARDISQEGPLSPIEVAARHRDGHDMVIEIRPSKIMGPDGKLKGLMGVAHDITERKRADDALRLANRQINLLTGITRHDILNKISVILGFLKITGKKFSDPVLGDYLAKMESATVAIREQIEFTRIYEDLGTHEPQWIDLDTVMPRSQVPATIGMNADIKDFQVYADPMLEKVFFNLLDNSVRHGQRVTEIRVSSHKEKENLVIIWEDNGTGIAAEEKERIFERGFGKNTGLGMFLVREILSLTKITITETGVPGKGAQFEIRVPEGAYRVT
jgi:PAS domain S-box-containing protein